MKCLMLTFFVITSFGFAKPAPNEAADLFVANKCVKCHSVDVAKIATTSKKPDEVADLSKAGADFANVGALKAYVKKETEREGKKHKLAFKGDDGDLNKIAAWLLTLK